MNRVRSVRSLPALLLALALPAAAAAAAPVSSASPGEIASEARLAGACPTFSWGAVEGADGYLLVVADVTDDAHRPEVRLRRELDGGALTSWTPALADCLAPGRSYLWTIGALASAADESAGGGSGGQLDATSWSRPRRFRIELAPSDEEISAALEVLSRARGSAPARSPNAHGPDQPRVPGAAIRGSNLGGGPPAIAAVRGESAAVSGAGVVGLATSDSGAAYGLYGSSASAGGAGVFGQASPSGGHGVRGENLADSGAAISGYASGGGGVIGVLGEVQSANGRALSGRNYSITGSARAVYGESASTGAWAINGYATASTGTTYGVRGDSISPSGYGVLGLSAIGGAGGGTGVAGETQSAGGKGVFARSTVTTSLTQGVWADVSSTEGRAVYAISRATTGTNYGIYSTVSSTNAYAGYFNGRVQVTGALSKGSGSFKIDHPLDPEHKYLYHSFVESPDMMNVYNGNVALDEQGEAWVEMPDWFEALNREFRYQLTALGAPSALWIGREIEGNRFLIRGGPRVRVSWQVTGIRKDPFAEKNRIPVEEIKPDAEQGTYLHPEAWGVDPALGLEARDLRSNPEPPPAARPIVEPGAPQ